MLTVVCILFSCSEDDNNEVVNISDINFNNIQGYSVDLMQYKCSESETQPIYSVCVTEGTLNEVKDYILSKVAENPDDIENYCPLVTFIGLDGNEYTGYSSSWNIDPEGQCLSQ